MEREVPPRGDVFDGRPMLLAFDADYYAHLPDEQLPHLEKLRELSWMVHAAAAGGLLGSGSLGLNSGRDLRHQSLPSELPGSVGVAAQQSVQGISAVRAWVFGNQGLGESADEVMHAVAAGSVLGQQVVVD